MEVFAHLRVGTVLSKNPTRNLAAMSTVKGSMQMSKGSKMTGWSRLAKSIKMSTSALFGSKN